MLYVCSGPGVDLMGSSGRMGERTEIREQCDAQSPANFCCSSRPQTLHVVRYGRVVGLY